MTSSTKFLSRRVWNSQIGFENFQIQNFLNQLFANNGLCINKAYLERRFNSLYLYVDLVQWYAKKTRKNKRIMDWINFQTQFENLSLEENLSNFQKVSHKIRILRRSKFPGQRYFYTKKYLFKKYGALEENLIKNIGLKILPLLSFYSQTKKIGLHFKYQALSIDKLPKSMKRALAYYKKSPFFLSGLSLFRWIFQGKGQPRVLANFIKYQIQSNYKDKRRMRWFLSFVSDVLKTFYISNKCKILGCRIEIYGRLQRKDRRNRLKRSFQQGSLPLQNLTASFAFHSTYAFTKNGLVNIKVWIHY